MDRPGIKPGPSDYQTEMHPSHYRPTKVLMKVGSKKGDYQTESTIALTFFLIRSDHQVVEVPVLVPVHFLDRSVTILAEIIHVYPVSVSVKPNVDFDRGEGMWTPNIKYSFRNFRRGGVATK